MPTEQDDARRVTIYAVAEHAGVSVATVSRVLSGSAPVASTTRQRVLRAVEELDYVPLRSGRSIATSGHQTAGLVLPGLRGPYYSELLSGFESTSAQEGQSTVVLVCDATRDAEAAVRRMLDHVDGVVIVDESVSDAVVRQVARTTPTVLVAREALPGCDVVQVENLVSSAELTRHVLEHGRRRLLFVGDPTPANDVSQRYLGFRQAIARHGGFEAAKPVRVAYEERAARHVMTALHALEAAGTTVDGLVCANDELALATMVLLTREGRSVPEDLVVVGFDDIMTSRYLMPGLTTVAQPMRELGRWAAIRLHERVGGRTSAVQPQVLPTRLVVRGSCGCAWEPAPATGL